MTPRPFKAYAKINLFLEITGKRPDGYHTLSTVFQTISMADELTVQQASGLHLRCSDASLPTDERNLAFRAALKLKDFVGNGCGVEIRLKKLTPMGAGLGGGSSDAAAVLQALVKLWKLKPSARQLHSCARELGADVPFFLKGGTCAAGGIGDELHPLPKLTKTWLVLVYPGFGVSTKEAYSRVHLPYKNIRSMKTLTAHLKRPAIAWAGHLFNRFEELVFPDYPQLPILKQELQDAGAINALMSGSGSCVFGVVENESQGRRVLSTMRKKYTQSWLVHTL